MNQLHFQQIFNRAVLPPNRLEGWLTQIKGLLLEGKAPMAAVGDMFQVIGKNISLQAEVVALRGQQAILMPYGPLSGLENGARLVPLSTASQALVGDSLLGRIIDPLGRPLDGLPMAQGLEPVPLYRKPLSLMERKPVKQRLNTGVKVLDAFVPLGMGQRLGIFSGPGVGKSTLLGMLARGSDADVMVIALVGERGREVQHFVEDVLGPKGMQRTVLVAATSDKPASERVRAAIMATAIAEYFRDRGRNVMLFVDSLTRICMAQREIGLAIGEPPTSKGYPPSAFSLLPQLLERVAPAKEGGSITGLYTVLVEGDDVTSPVADAARGLLDGHIILSRSQALKGLYPAVDVLQSLSRLEGDLQPPEILKAARNLRHSLTMAEEAKELIAVGAYHRGTDPLVDKALAKRPAIEAFLRQQEHQHQGIQATHQELLSLSKDHG